MSTLYVSLLLLQSVYLTLQWTIFDDYYTAAVVEYHSQWTDSLTPRANLESNLKVYEDIIKEAAKYKADIVLFPESGLTAEDNDAVVIVPDPKREEIIPAYSDSYDPVLRKMSEAAIQSSIYVALNVYEIEEDRGQCRKYEFKNGAHVDSCVYNTNIVFDRKGKLVARYRKFKLFGELYLDRPWKAEIVYFDTDFGVRFGTFICLDILFPNPALRLLHDYNVTNFLFTTAWFSELPAMLAIQPQYSWSYVNNVNLLAANHNNVSRGTSGSGIYRGKNIDPIYQKTNLDGTFIILGRLPKNHNRFDSKIKKYDNILHYTKYQIERTSLHHSLQRDTSNYVGKLISPLGGKTVKEDIVLVNNLPVGMEREYIINDRVCKRRLCCTFDMVMSSVFYKESYINANKEPFNENDSFHLFRYRMTAWNGFKGHYGVLDEISIQACTIIPCIEKHVKSCNLVPTEIDSNNYFMQHKELGKLKLYSTFFNKVIITGNFSSGNSFPFPTALTSTNEPKIRFGNFPIAKNFKYTIRELTNNTEIKIKFRAKKLISASITYRLFDNDNLISYWNRK